MNDNNIAVVQDEVSNQEIKALWVFAYGSLCWKPGFKFHKAVMGHIAGYQRRFWQGNATHRGTEERPGRVATLVENDKDVVHGIAFAISGEDALPYLSNRECEMGGYMTQFTTFYPKNGEAFKVLLYLATPKNPHWIGEDDINSLADQIVECSGPSGHNVEYVVRLANCMRNYFPNHEDHHLFELETALMHRIKRRNMCLKSLMGNGEGCITLVKQTSRNSSPTRGHPVERTDTFQFTTRVPEKQLRCLNI